MIKNRYNRIPDPALNTKRERDTYNSDGTKIKTAQAKSQVWPEDKMHLTKSLFEGFLFLPFRYSVFGLGSSAYPNFCAFAHYLDNMFFDLGAERISKMSEGDELCGQEESFRRWAQDIFKVTKNNLVLNRFHMSSLKFKAVINLF